MIYHRPTGLEEALALLVRSDARAAPLGGGTHLLAQPDSSIEDVVDLQGLGLDRIEMRDGVLHIGATATLEAVATSPTVQAVADGLIAKVAQRSASSVLRQQATVAGTLLAAANRTGLPVALLALGAHVIIEPGPRRLSLEELWISPSEHLAGSLITEVVVPVPPADADVSFERVSRTPSDRAIVAVAALHKADRWRIAVGGGLPNPVLIQVADGEETSADVSGIPFATDTLASAEYRQAMAKILIGRVE